MGGRGRTEAEQKGKRAKSGERKWCMNPTKSQRHKNYLCGKNAVNVCIVTS